MRSARTCARSADPCSPATTPQGCSRRAGTCACSRCRCLRRRAFAARAAARLKDAADPAPRSRRATRSARAVAVVAADSAAADSADPEVALTDLERKKMFDMAMEMHELQRRGTDLAVNVQTLSRQAADIATALGSRADVPAEVKASFEAFNKELATLTPKFAAPTGGGGGGGPGGAPTGDQPLARAAQAKNGLMGGMPATEQTMKAYADAKAQMPKVAAEANALFAKAATLGPALAKYNLTLTAPQTKAVGSKPSSVDSR